MKRQHAEQLASRIRGESPESGVSVEHVRDGAPDPFGYVVMIDGRQISSPAAWLSMQIADSGSDEKWAAFALRLPSALKADLETFARQHGRSLNSEIVQALSRYVMEVQP